MFRVGRCRHSSISSSNTSLLFRSKQASNASVLCRNESSKIRLLSGISSSQKQSIINTTCLVLPEKITNKESQRIHNTSNTHEVYTRMLQHHKSLISHRGHANNTALCVRPLSFHTNSSNENKLFYRTIYNLCIRNASSSSGSFSFNIHGNDMIDVKKKSTSTASFSTKSSSSTGPSSGTTTSSSSSSITPTPSSNKSVPHKIKSAITSVSKSIVNVLASTPGVLWFYVTHPIALKEKLSELWEAAKKEAHHYWMGSKLLAADIRTARRMLGRLLLGSTLTRRERKQLIRTTTDLFRLVPFSIFVIIPFMEFALPLALKLFPNMLPSTFQDSLKQEENMKRELQSRIAMAGFFQETLQSLANESRKTASKRKEIKESEDGSNTNESIIEEKREETAASFLQFLEQARKGVPIPPEVIIKYATYFRDDLTMDNMSRMQLINMCKYMGIPPYGADSLLRFQLRHKVKSLKEDDQRILWEGIDALTTQELREACRERGMRSTGLRSDGYKMALQQWLDISVNKHVPITLLIMSRTFFLEEKPSLHTGEEKTMTGIADAISGLEKGVVNEVVLEVADEKQDPDYMKIKLEALRTQNELIDVEYEERELEREKEKLKEMEREKEKEEKEKKELEKAAYDTAMLQQQLLTSKQIKGKGEQIVDTAYSKPIHEDTSTIGSKEIGKTAVDEEEELDLSTEEMEAISQLISPSAVTSEREEYERLKAAMTSSNNDEDKVDDDTNEVVISSDATESVDVVEGDDVLSNMKDKNVEDISTADDAKAEEEKQQRLQEEDLMMTSEMADLKAAKTISEMDADASKIASESTHISLEGKDITTEEGEPQTQTTTTAEEIEQHDITTEEEEEEESGSGDRNLDKSIARLKSRVEAMVGKIELQLTDVEKKIGDKLHLLDKDADGIISTDEMTVCLRSVLKRNLTQEEITAIVDDMDSNEDGAITVAELAIWIDTNKFVKLAEEGRDAELDREIEKKIWDVARKEGEEHK